jgi:glutamate:GABA antiporter
MAAPQSMPATLRRELGPRDLTLFALICIASTRWIPIAAHAGPASIVLWVLAAVLFAVPLTITVTTLTARYPGPGGLYLWTYRDFGAWHGFLGFWSYWLGIAFLLPTAALLYSQVAVSAFESFYGPLGEGRFYLLGVTLALIWIALGSNLVGMKVGKWTENVGALATGGVGIALVAIAYLMWKHRGPATPMNVLPTWNWRTVSFSAGIAFALTGMEGAGMMAAEIRNPESTIPRAGWTATLLAAFFYISATLAFLVVLPPDRISELNGFADIAEASGQFLGTPWIAPLFGVLVLASGLGLLGGLGTASSRMPFAAGVDRLLPSAFGKVHPRWGTPYVSILVLGFVATFLLVIYQVGDTMRAAYDELVSVMLITGFLPFIYIFGSAWKAGRRLSAVSGGAVTLLALICSVVPPEPIKNVWLFEAKLGLGTLAVVFSARILYHRSQRALRSGQN